jgi:hypothetical protein
MVIQVEQANNKKTEIQQEQDTNVQLHIMWLCYLVDKRQLLLAFYSN